jgi:hypothetical protein
MGGCGLMRKLILEHISSDDKVQEYMVVEQRDRTTAFGPLKRDGKTWSSFIYFKNGVPAFRLASVSYPEFQLFVRCESADTVGKLPTLFVRGNFEDQDNESIFVQNDYVNLMEEAIAAFNGPNGFGDDMEDRD